VSGPPDHGDAPAATGPAETSDPAPAAPRGPVRWLLFAAGLACVALGLVGAVVPGLPTTVFLILALAAFARSSPRLHRWLWTHPRFGPPLQAWVHHGAVSRRGKIAAVVAMAISLGIVAATSRSVLATAVVAAVMAGVAAWLVTRPDATSTQGMSHRDKRSIIDR